MSRILVTGGTGFIGSALTQRLTGLSHEVKTFSKSVDGDLAEHNPSKGLTKGTDFVFHLAANLNMAFAIKSPAGIISANVSATMKLLEDIRLNHPECILIFTSSDRVYGDSSDNPLSENSQCNPIDPYGCSKLMSEVLIKAYAEIMGLKYVILRSGIVFGPNQQANLFIPSVIRRIKEGEKELKVGRLRVYRSMIFIDDLVDVLIRSMSRPEALMKTFNISSYHLEISDVAGVISELTGAKIISDLSQLRESRFEMPGHKLDCAAAKSVLGWGPSLDFTEAMKRTVQ